MARRGSWRRITTASCGRAPITRTSTTLTSRAAHSSAARSRARRRKGRARRRLPQGLFIAVATPLVASAGAAPEGVLVAAYALDDSARAGREGRHEFRIVAFVALDTLGHPYVVGTTLPADQIGPALAADSAAIAGLTHDSSGAELAADIGGERLIGLAAPIRSAGGDLYGAVVPFRSRDAELAGFRALQRTMTLAIALGVALALGLAFILARADHSTGASARGGDAARPGRGLQRRHRRHVTRRNRGLVPGVQAAGRRPA